MFFKNKISVLEVKTLAENQKHRILGIELSASYKESLVAIFQPVNVTFLT